ncbi:MAG TPA: universal stress protein [Terriglobales bacterium]|nr:universal stress protein [Terriglobales bacterium]
METLDLEQSVSFKNLLLATDFSSISKSALAYAAAIASRYRSKIYVVHVIPPEPRMPIPMEVSFPELDRDRRQAELAMQAFVSGDQLKAIRHETLLPRGPIWLELSELIESHEIDLLVVGTRGRAGLRKVILGSVAEELFRQASCPVLTIGPAVPAGMGTELRRILLATDFGEASQQALPYAFALAADSNAALTLLHVLMPSPFRNIGPYWYMGRDVVEAHETAQRNTLGRLKQLIPPERKLGSDPELLVGFGLVSHEIVRIAAASQADLIVMGVNRAASVRVSAHLPWATAYEVVGHAKCPVLTVRA